MTKGKQVAESLKNTQINPTILAIQDRSTDITDTINIVMNYWTYDLFSRKPSPAYTEDGVFQGTDLDLAAFLFALKDRGAVINIPNYSSMRGGKVTEGVTVVSKENRHGQLLGVVANKETFVFSLKMKDMNVISTDEVGAFRNFTLTDFDGGWYSGWKTIQFKPNTKENEFMTKTKIMDDNKINFKNFIHPNRWVSFYGKYYFTTKLLIERLTNEAAYYYQVIKDMNKEGLILEKVAYPEVIATEETKSIIVDAFEVAIDFIDSINEFPKYEHTLENLQMLTEKRKLYVYTIIPSLRFMTRATECAFNKHVQEFGLNSFPAWLKDVKWEEGYIPKGKRTIWNRIVYYQPGVCKQGVAIRFRKWKKTERVNERYNG